MTQPDLDAIRARAEAATPGPWTLRNGWVPSGAVIRCARIANDQHDNVLVVEGRNIAGRVADLEFIAHAQDDVPALLAEVQRQAAVIEQMADDYATETARLRRILRRTEMALLEATPGYATGWALATSSADGSGPPLWQHVCGHVEAFPTESLDEIGGGCDACESASDQKSDWQPLFRATGGVWR